MEMKKELNEIIEYLDKMRDFVQTFNANRATKKVSKEKFDRWIATLENSKSSIDELEGILEEREFEDSLYVDERDDEFINDAIKDEERKELDTIEDHLDGN